MIPKYRIDINNKNPFSKDLNYLARIYKKTLKYFQLVIDFSQKKLKIKKTKNNFPEWTRIKRQNKNIFYFLPEFLKRLFEYYPKINKVNPLKHFSRAEKVIYTSLTLIALTSVSMLFLFNSVNINRLSYANEFSVMEIKKNVNEVENIIEIETNTNSKINSSNSSSKANSITVEKETFSEFGRLYFLNENTETIEWSEELRINTAFNFEIKQAQENIKIIWDELYETATFNNIEANSCLFSVYPYSSDELITTFRSKIENGRCEFEFGIENQVFYNDYLIKAQIIDKDGNKYFSDTTLILN
jgi:cell division protein FtsL